MTRKSFALRHIRLIPPTEETAMRYLLHWHAGDLYASPSDFPRITSEGLFSNSAPLELEVGCGTGEFICSLAERDPHSNFVGLDISPKALFAAVENARRRSLSNIKFIKAPVQLVYPLLVPDSLRAVYLHFPDPCLRPKYRKVRIFGDKFLDEVHTALRRGGTLSVMTDVHSLFWDMLAQMESDGRFATTHHDRYLVGFEPEVKSRYQAIWEQHGTTPLRFEAEKVAAPVAARG